MKKLMSFNLSAGLAAMLLLNSCASDEPITSSPDVIAENCGEYAVSIEEAINYANLVFNEMEKGSATRSTGKDRVVKSVEMISSNNTRSSESEGLFYLINYENNQGFALMGADRRVEPVYAISDEGRLNMSDTVFNKSLAFVMNDIMDAAVADMEGGTPYPGGWGNINLPHPIDPPLFLHKVPQMIDSYAKYWDQSGPFNKYCYEEGETPVPTGCVPVAMGILMSYFEWPASYNGYQYNWTAMKNDLGELGVPQLLKDLGNKYNLKVVYDKDGSGCYPERYAPTFRNMQYTVVRNLTTLDRTAVCNYLRGIADGYDGKTPILVRGTTTVYNQEKQKYEDVGHAWVIDGEMTASDKNEMGQVIEGSTLFHCIWGWAGNGNGYFYLKQSNTIGGSKPDRTEDVDDDPDAVVEHTFRGLQYMVVKKN